MKITKEHFRSWQKDLVTKDFFREISERITDCKTQLCDPDLIMNADSGKVSARLLGHIDVLSALLSITFEELVSNEDDTNASKL